MDDLRGRPDKRQVRRSFERASGHYDDFAVLQREVRQRLLQRLDPLRLTPQRIVDLGCGTGYSVVALGERYPDARIHAVDIAPGMLQQARKRLGWWQRRKRRHDFVCADAEALPFADASCDLLFSSLTFQWCNDLAGLFAECRRVLRPGGLLLFSSFGESTLHELRASWQAVDGHSHVNRFDDLHAIGNALQSSGLRDVVTDIDRFTLTYPDAKAVMRDLKGIGAHNVTADRPRGLTTPRRLARVVAAYEGLRTEAGLPASYEVVYGHAWRLEAKAEAVGGESAAVIAWHR